MAIAKRTRRGPRRVAHRNVAAASLRMWGASNALHNVRRTGQRYTQRFGNTNLKMNVHPIILGERGAEARQTQAYGSYIHARKAKMVRRVRRGY